MAKVTKNQKVLKVLRFLMGLRLPEAYVPLKRYGLTEQELSIAAELVRNATEPRLAYAPDANVNPALLQQLDELDNQWFPIIKHVLTRHYPEIAEWTFLNLSQTSGIELVVSVRTLFDRVQALEDGTSPFADKGVAAFQLLRERGLNEETTTRAAQLLSEVTEFVEARPRFDEAAYNEAVDKLWAWYLEWSGIARAAIKDRRTLRRLGFLRSNSVASAPSPSDQDEQEASQLQPEVLDGDDQDAVRAVVTMGHKLLGDGGASPRELPENAGAPA